MSSSRAASVTKVSPRRFVRTKTEEVANVIESLLEKHGVAPLAPKALQIGKVIGKGRFKKVNEGHLRQQCGGDCIRVVVVQYEKKDSEVRELDIIALLARQTNSSPFVPQVFGVVSERTVITIVQEHAQYGTLKNFFSSPDVPLQMGTAHMQQAAMQVAKALNFLESVHIVHADLACRNVLVFSFEADASKLITKITDFGLAVVLEDGVDSMQIKQPLATRWCAPEAVALNKLSYRTDVWSYGVAMWELFSECALPWKALEKRADVTAQLLSLATPESVQPDFSDHFPIPDLCPRGTYDIFLSCLRIDEDARPSAAQLHEALSQVCEAFVNAIEDGYGIGVSVEAVATADSGSTEASVADVSPKSSRSPVRKDEQATQFEVLRSFLWSPRANDMLSSSEIQAMQNEIVEALSRDSYPTQITDPRFQKYLGEEETKDVRSHSNSVATCTTVTREVQPVRTPIREIFLSSIDGPVRSWEPAPPLHIWTLWSLLDDGTLRRRDFACEEVARAALEADGFGALVEQKVFARSPPCTAAINRRWIPVEP